MLLLFQGSTIPGASLPKLVSWQAGREVSGASREPFDPPISPSRAPFSLRAPYKRSRMHSHKLQHLFVESVCRVPQGSPVFPRAAGLGRPRQRCQALGRCCLSHGEIERGSAGGLRGLPNRSHPVGDVGARKPRKKSQGVGFFAFVFFKQQRSVSCKGRYFSES